MVTVKVSKKFLADRESRELPIGNVLSFSGNKAKLELDDETLSDIVSDPAYKGWHTDCSEPGFIRAARTAFRDLVKGGAHYAPGVTTNYKTGLLMPKDAY